MLKCYLRKAPLPDGHVSKGVRGERVFGEPATASPCERSQNVFRVMVALFDSWPISDGDGVRQGGALLV